MRRWSSLSLLALLPVLVATGAHAGATGEPVAVLTQIRHGQGEVQVRLAAEGEWTAPLPLLALGSGDQIRATQNARVVLLFTAGQGTVTVSAVNSPYTVQPPSVTSSSPFQDLLRHLSRVLMGQKKELRQVPLASRGVEQRPLLVAPKDGPLLVAPRDGALLGAPTFEWSGSERIRYAVRIVGPEGTLWGQSDLPCAPLTYPMTAPQLRPGVAYRWELDARGFPTQQGQFTILPGAEAGAVRNTLAALTSQALAGYPRQTIALLRAAYLFERGLFTDSRDELQVALATESGEPTLHVMLGQVYERTGLPELAAREFAEARFLTAGGH